jgi:hypothetical protein
MIEDQKFIALSSPVSHPYIVSAYQATTDCGATCLHVNRKILVAASQNEKLLNFAKEQNRPVEQVVQQNMWHDGSSMFLRGGGFSDAVRPNDWIVFNNSGSVSHFTAEEFAKRFSAGPITIAA